MTVSLKLQRKNFKFREIFVDKSSEEILFIFHKQTVGKFPRLPQKICHRELTQSKSHFSINNRPQWHSSIHSENVTCEVWPKYFDRIRFSTCSYGRESNSPIIFPTGHWSQPQPSGRNYLAFWKILHVYM